MFQYLRVFSLMSFEFTAVYFFLMNGVYEVGDIELRVRANEIYHYYYI